MTSPFLSTARRDMATTLRRGGTPELAALTRDSAPALCARQEGLEPLLASGAHTNSKKAAFAQRVRATVAGDLTAKIVETLEQRELPCVILKGTAVAAAAWDDPDLRVQSDVDVLVAPEHFERASEALRARRLVGARLIEGRTYHHAAFAPGPAGALPIELHHSLTLDVPLNVNTRDLIGRRTWIDSGYGTIPTLSDVDAAVYLATHASIHGLCRLAWLLDLAGYADKRTVDWTVAADRACQWGSQTAVFCAWRAAVDALGASIPEPSIERLRISPAKAHLCALVSRRIAPGQTMGSWPMLFRALLIPTPAAAATLFRTKLLARYERTRGRAIADDG